MPDRLHVHLPFRDLERFLPFILEHRLQPEVAFVATDFSPSMAASLQQLAASLNHAGLSATVHAPFMDLNPGAVDPLVSQATLFRCQQTLDAAAILGAKLVVFHPGYDRWRYSGNSGLWIDQSKNFWPRLLKCAEQLKIRLALENIFEENPETLITLVNEIDSDWLGHCFDTGHWNLFGQVSLTDWLSALGSRLFHLHLHDNFGDRDAHLPIGEGKIDFPLLFDWLARHHINATMTLEAHSQDHLLRSRSAALALISAVGKGLP